LFLLLSLFEILSCNNRTNGQEVDNTKPMYGEIPKNEEYKKADDEFREESLSQFKTIDSAVVVQIDQAWRYFYHEDVNILVLMLIEE